MKKNYSAALAGVTVYRHLLKLPPLAALTRLFRALEQQDGENALEGYTETFYTLTQEGTDSLSDYLVDQLRYGISSYAQAAAHGQAGVVLTQAAERDLAVFASLAALEPSEIKAELAALGFSDFRVRLLDGCARIQVRPEQLALVLEQREKILQKLKQYYRAVVLDLEVRGE